MEREIGIPIYASVAVTSWKSLSAAGIDPSYVMEWGSLFRDARPAARVRQHPEANGPTDLTLAE